MDHKTPALCRHIDVCTPLTMIKHPVTPSEEFWRRSPSDSLSQYDKSPGEQVAYLESALRLKTRSADLMAKQAKDLFEANKALSKSRSDLKEQLHQISQQNGVLERTLIDWGGNTQTFSPLKQWDNGMNRILSEKAAQVEGLVALVFSLRTQLSQRVEDLKNSNTHLERHENVEVLEQAISQMESTIQTTLSENSFLRDLCKSLSEQVLELKSVSNCESWSISDGANIALAEEVEKMKKDNSMLRQEVEVQTMLHSQLKTTADAQVALNQSLVAENERLAAALQSMTDANDYGQFPDGNNNSSVSQIMADLEREKSQRIEAWEERDAAVSRAQKARISENLLMQQLEVLENTKFQLEALVRDQSARIDKLTSIQDKERTLRLSMSKTYQPSKETTTQTVSHHFQSIACQTSPTNTTVVTQTENNVMSSVCSQTELSPATKHIECQTEYLELSSSPGKKSRREKQLVLVRKKLARALLELRDFKKMATGLESVVVSLHASLQQSTSMYEKCHQKLQEYASLGTSIQVTLTDTDNDRSTTKTQQSL